MENRVSVTLENILDKIDETLENLERGNEAIISAAVYTFARTYDLLAQYNDTCYIEDGEDE